MSRKENKMETQTKQNPRILIVEDQLDTLRSLENAVRTVFPKYHLSFQAYEVARCYQEAQSAVQNNVYDFVLLDHRMPELPFPEPDVIRKGGSLSDLTKEEQAKYFKQEDENSRNSKGIGYNLINLIKQKNPETRVIGTSSMAREITRFPQPDYSMRKFPGQAEEDLERILVEETGGRK